MVSHLGQGVGTAWLLRLQGDRERAMLAGTWKAASWAVRFCQHHGFRLMTDDETRVLPRRSWMVPERQIDESVVPADARWTR